MAMTERTHQNSEYRYGFNGIEQSNELDQNGNSYTAEFWQYDAKIARRWNIDPVVVYWESSYAAFRNNPIRFNDPNGDCADCKHKTVEGDTYGKLAQQYGVSVDQLRKWNGYEDKKIPIGVELIVSDPNVIGKSKKVPGVGDDMGSGNMTNTQVLRDINFDLSSNALIMRQEWTNEELEKDMSSLAEDFADSDRDKKMTRGVFNHFYGSTGTPYTSKLLTESVKIHPSTKRFMYKQIAPTFQKLVTEHGGYKPNGTFDLQLEGNPRFNEIGFLGWGHGDEDNGLKITINDVHAYQVRVVSYIEIQSKYHAVIELTLYDHFGLNLSDMNEHPYKFFYNAFYSWYILQWQRGYKPFVTTIPIQFNISGTLNKE